jgi:hypothetical protein
MSLLLPALLGLALAQAPTEPPGTVTVRVAIDDRGPKRLVAPMLELDVEGVAPAAFSDDGAVDGDVVQDHILMATVDADQREELTFRVRDGGVVLGSFDVLLPSAGAADFALKSVAGDPPLVLDLAAPPMPGGGDGPGLEVGEGERAGDDQISLRVFVDDRAVVRLQEPRIVVDQTGASPADLLDDGSLDGDTARDRVFVGELTVARAQYVTLYVRDRGVDVGQAKVFLPSTAEAEVNLVTLDGAAGVELKSEPTATGSTETPATGTAAMGGGGDRFVHVLWVALALFAMGFAYVRAVVSTRWEDEVRPLLARLRRHLDRVAPEEE